MAKRTKTPALRVEKLAKRAASCFSPKLILTCESEIVTGLSPAQDRTLAGIGLMLAAMFAFSLNDVMGKWLVATYGVGQLLLIRSVAGLVMLVPAIAAMSAIMPMPDKTRPMSASAQAGLRRGSASDARSSGVRP